MTAIEFLANRQDFYGLLVCSKIALSSEIEAPQVVSIHHLRPSAIPSDSTKQSPGLLPCTPIEQDEIGRARKSKFVSTQNLRGGHARRIQQCYTSTHSNAFINFFVRHISILVLQSSLLHNFHHVASVFNLETDLKMDEARSDIIDELKQETRMQRIMTEGRIQSTHSRDSVTQFFYVLPLFVFQSFGCHHTGYCVTRQFGQHFLCECHAFTKAFSSPLLCRLTGHVSSLQVQNRKWSTSRQRITRS